MKFPMKIALPGFRNILSVKHGFFLSVSTSKSVAFFSERRRNSLLQGPHAQASHSSDILKSELASPLVSLKLYIFKVTFTHNSIGNGLEEEGLLHWLTYQTVVH